METSSSVRVSCLLEELKFVVETDFSAFVVVNSSNALNYLVLILFNPLFGAEVAHVVELRVSNSVNVLFEVATEEAYDAFDVFILPQLSHFLQVGAYLVVVVQVIFRVHFPLDVAFFDVKRPRTLLPSLVVLHSAHYLLQFVYFEQSENEFDGFKHVELN